MLKFLRRALAGQPDQPRTPPPPGTPVEVGLALRAARERSGLDLAELRSQTSVPIIDLEALERGQLELLHVEQAGVVALWRYAEAVGLEPEPLVDVLRRAWPNQALGIDAVRPITPGLAMPISQIGLAEQFLGKIVNAKQLAGGSSRLGISASTRKLLSATSETTVLAVAGLGTASLRRRPAPLAQKGKKGGKTATSAKSTSGPKKARTATKPAKPTQRSTKTAPRRTLAAGTVAQAEVVERPAPEPLNEPVTGVTPTVEASPARPVVPVEYEPDAGILGSPAESTRAIIFPRPLSSGGPSAALEGEQKERPWPRQVAKVIAERFGVQSDEDTTPGGTTNG